MNVGDIVYFKSEYTIIEGSTSYLFKPGDRYLINDLPKTYLLGEIKNLEDGTHHYATLDHLSKMINIGEWRKLQIDKILIP